MNWKDKVGGIEPFGRRLQKNCWRKNGPPMAIIFSRKKFKQHETKVAGCRYDNL